MRPALAGLLACCAACILSSEPQLAGAPTPPVLVEGGIVLSATARRHDDVVRVYLQFRNQGVTPGRILFGPCSFATKIVVGFNVVLDNSLRPTGNCPENEVLIELSAGASREYLVLEEPVTLLRKSTWTARYHFSVFYLLEGDPSLVVIIAGALIL